MVGSEVLQAAVGGVDYEVLVAMAVTGFFAALAVILLARYRRLSTRITTSSDLGKQLWDSLEARLKIQDERILDLMTRLEVLQTRTVEKAKQSGFHSTAPAQIFSMLSQLPTPSDAPQPALTQPQMERHRPLQTRVKKPGGPDSAEMKALRYLAEGPRTSVEIKELTDLSREHAARVMKDLYDRGLVLRDDSHKPFVYRLTDVGRNYLSAG